MNTLGGLRNLDWRFSMLSRLFLLLALPVAFLTGCGDKDGGDSAAEEEHDHDDHEGEDHED
jgi:hypothetical protein